MLKISVDPMNGQVIALRLDGELSGRWVKLLQRTCAELGKHVLVTIDLKNVGFADRDGIALLRGLSGNRVQIVNALPFIAAQIRNATPESKNDL